MFILEIRIISDEPKWRKMNRISSDLEHSRRSKAWNDFKSKMGKLWSLLALVILYFTKIIFIKDPVFGLISNVFILAAGVFFIQFLWRVVHLKLLRILLVLIIVVSLSFLVIIDTTKEIQKLKGILFPPARSGELLIIVAEFEQRGSLGIDPTSRIVDRLNFELEKTNIKNARIAIVPKICDEKKARQIGKIHNAIFVLWGWYDDFGFNPIFTITKEGPQPLEKVELPEISTEIEDFNLFIREVFPKQMVYLGTFTIGQVYYWQDEYEKALNAFNIVLGNLYRDSRKGSVLIQKDAIILLYSYRGNTYLKMGHPHEAIADYTRVIELDPNYARAYGNRGLAHKTNGNLDQAMADYSKAIELNPVSVPDYINRGNLHQDLDSIKLAIADYTKAIEHDSMCILAYFNRGTAYDSNDNPELAIADYTRVLELNSSYAPAYNNRGRAYEKTDNLDQAFVDYTKAIKYDSLFVEAYNNRGNVYQKRGHFKLAITEYDKAIEVDSTYALTYNNRGLIYHKEGILDSAIIDFTKAIKYDSMFVEAYNNRSSAYWSAGSLDQAFTDCATIINIDSTFAPAYYNRGLVHQRWGNDEEAILDYSKSIELAPTYALAYFNRGNIYKKKGNLDEAIKNYSKCIELDSSYAYVYRNRGYIYQEKDFEKQAVDDLEMYLRLNPDASDRAEIEKIIQEIQQ